jgi:AcrR family transcriptional regulator
MAEVKRRYHAPVRTEHAAQTRQRILQAAAEAFAQRGWVGTTIAGVAQQAGVSAQAVHLSVGAKPALLISAIQHAAGGDQPDVPLVDREPFRHAYAADADLHQRATAFAAGTRQVYQRAGRLFLVLAQAAGLDPELAALWDRARSARLQDCQRLVDLTGRRRRPLRRQLTDLLFVQSGPGVHADLVVDRRWSHDAYQAWLTTAVENLLASTK